MNIQINDNYRITSDKHNVILEEKKVAEKGKNAGQAYYKQIAFYPSLQLALKGFAKFNINFSNAESIEELQQLLINIDKTIERVSK